MSDTDIRDAIYICIQEGRRDEIGPLVEKALEDGKDPLKIIEVILNPALKEVGDKFDSGDIFLPELIMSAEAMQAAVEILQPHLEKHKQQMKVTGRVVMAAVQGDIHDDHVRLDLLDRPHGLGRILGMAADLQVLLLIDQLCKALANDGMVVHDENAVLGRPVGIRRHLRGHAAPPFLLRGPC